MRRKIRFLFIVPVWAFMSCRSAASVETTLPESRPAPVISSAKPDAPANKIWQLHLITQSQSYQAESISILESGGIRDSLVSQLRLTLNSQPEEATIVFSGTINSISIHAGSRLGQTEPLNVPIAFSGHVDKGSISLISPTECDEKHAPVELLVPQILIRFPENQLTIGSSWADSIVLSTCNGMMPITTTVITHYRIAGTANVEGQEALVIDRTEQRTSRGGGSKEQHQVTLEGSSTGVSQVWIDSTTGRLLKSTADATGMVAVTASGRTQTFNQRIRTVIAANR